MLADKQLSMQPGVVRAFFGMQSIKLVGALLGIFAFFVVAIGVQEAVLVKRSNAKLLQELQEQGVGEQQQLEDPRLQNPWARGYDSSLRFLGSRNLETIARQTTIVGIAALGMALVIISGGIDLSVGSLVALSTVVIAWLLQRLGAGPLTAALGGIAIAGLFGFISGTLITRLRVVPFIVTLGMMLIVRGAAKGIGQEQKIDVDIEKLQWLEELLASVPKDKGWMLVPPGVWLLILLAIVMAGMLRYSRLGRHIFAIGSNEQTARLCGIAVEKVKIIVYSLCGAFAGLAGLMQFSRLTVGDPTVAVGLELDVIAAVVIGGGSLSGGEGSILGTLVGALIMTVIASGCTQMGLPNWVQEIITGAIIVLAVALDRLRHRRAS
jgi:ribose/xylose/arabinose/galactoside ABC-type transport system permease subunit